MRVRYAVLWDLDDPNPEHQSIPCGFAIDRGDHVEIRLCGEGNWGIKPRFADPYEMLQPDGKIETTKPGDPGYFFCVLNIFHRTFAITIPSDSGAHAEHLTA